MDIKKFAGIDSFYKKPDGTKMEHDELYSKVVNAIGLYRLVPLIPATKSEVETALQSDVHLNNIPLRKWDARHHQVRDLMRGIGITVISLSETVCTLKQAAKMWAAE